MEGWKRTKRMASCAPATREVSWKNTLPTFLPNSPITEDQREREESGVCVCVFVCPTHLIYWLRQDLPVR